MFVKSEIWPMLSHTKHGNDYCYLQLCNNTCTTTILFSAYHGWPFNQVTINAGVRQGSVLSATLFFPPINNLLNPDTSGKADGSTIVKSNICNPRAGAVKIQSLREDMIEHLNLNT